jgi:putative phosphoribosyl transferase
LRCAVDLLGDSEGADRHNVFDVDLQTTRLLQVTAWLSGQADMENVPLVYFGDGIGASVVLEAAARQPSRASAIVVRGGRPDVAAFWLPRVTAPTLFIVDGSDATVQRQAECCCRQLRCEKEIVIVESPGHLFCEREAIEEVGQHARRWFLKHLVAPRTARLQMSPTA